MKSMEEYINEVYEKYDELEKQNIKYKTIKMKQKNPMVSLCGVAACLMLAIFVGIGIKNNPSEIKPSPNEFVSTETSDSGDIIYTRYVTVDGKYNQKYLKNLINKSELVCVVSEFDVNGYDYKEANGKFIFEKKLQSRVQEILKGENITENEFIIYLKSFGTVSLAELEKIEGYDWKKWEVEYLGGEIPEEQKEKTYYNQIPTKGIAEPEKDKQYILFLNYDEKNGCYKVWDMGYGMMEYDPTTNSIKNIDTGEFEQLDKSLFQID